MLHEVAHIVHGRHAGPFYRLMQELIEEWETHVMKVPSGSLLDAEGDVTDAGLNLVSKFNGCFTGKGKRLGGRSINWKQLSQRDCAARAAERRARDAARGLGDDELHPLLRHTLRKGHEQDRQPTDKLSRGVRSLQNERDQQPTSKRSRATSSQGTKTHSDDELGEQELQALAKALHESSLESDMHGRRLPTEGAGCRTQKEQDYDLTLALALSKSCVQARKMDCGDDDRLATQRSKAEEENAQLKRALEASLLEM